MQAVVQKQMKHGLQYQVSYTFSKCMSDSTGYYGAWNNALSASAYWQNVYDQKSEYAPCYYDATHVISAYAIYDLPFGRGKMFGKNASGVVNGVIGGWEVSPIVSFRTGWPMPVYGASDNSGTFGRGARADCNGVPSITNTFHTGNWPSVVQQHRPVYQSGSLEPSATAHRNSQICVRLITATSTSVCIRTSRLRSDSGCSSEADFINAFNHVQLNAPNMGLGATMGQITSAQPPRNIQLALKLYY